ncbi:MAG: carboxypeptidase-like regulatory domain-containing protein, partial [Acidobacteriota bacterium]|nr:carboxypeptidase-like regulatory domain-containing protein [Acidobacteriota bacterium]
MSELARTGIIKCAVALFLFAAAAYAQFNGSIEGIVQDPSSAGVANAKITLLNTATNVSQQTKADNSGNYRFVSLAPGSYKITATGAGFGKSDVNVTLTTGQTLNVPVSLQLASAATTVEVTSSAPIIDTAETRNQQTIQSEQLSVIPLA